MTEQNNITIPLSRESELALQEIIKKYGLEENLDGFFRKIKELKSLNETVIIRLIRDLMMEKISTHQFLDSLKSSLGISEEITKNLAKDIISELMPLLKKYTEKELKNYKSPIKPVEETTNNAAKIILEKIKQNNPSAPEIIPVIKKPVITDVEKNAETLKIKGKIGQDKYREPVE